MDVSDLLNSALGAPLRIAADTVVTVPARDLFDFIYGASAALLAILLILLLYLLLAVVAQLRASARAIDEAKAALSEDEAMQSLRRTMTYVEEIARQLHGETARLTGAIGHLSDRVEQISSHTEQRIEDLNALVTVVQEELEETFVETASRARGVRAGLNRLTEKREHRSSS
jgi:methyl-accepting chemotaxis protein